MRTTTNLLILFILLFSILGCKNAEQAKENTQISTKIELTLSDKNLKVLDLSIVTGKSWDKVCVIYPYAVNSTVEKEIGFAWDVESNTDISADENISLLLFVENNQVVEFVQHPRRKGDFLTENNIYCLSKTVAKFAVENIQDSILLFPDRSS